MKGRPIDQLVYETMFPKPRQQDPHSFQALLQRHLVLEVRQEVHSFYGHLDTQEAKYPGLDYTHHIHRIRLSRWPWHRRLFRAFDALRLTHAEISGLTKWEGTKWAKERFEREQGVIIRDTTADGFPEFVEPENRRTPERQQEDGPQETEEQRIEVVTGTNEDNLGEESDGPLESVGVPLNERLRERVALRNQSGDLSMPIDEEWETWLKSVIEAGDFQQITGQLAHFSQSEDPSTLLSASIFPPRMVAAARAGQWDEIPDPLRDVIRQSLEAEPATPQPRVGTTRRGVAAAPNPSARTSARLSRPRDYTERDEERRVEPPPHIEAA